MPAFTLYGARGSTNTDRIRLTLAEGGFTDFDHVLLDLGKGEQKSPANLSRHPWGKVPSVVFPNSFTLYESRAICKYLARRYSIPLLPAESDLDASALFEQALSVETNYFADPAGKIGFEKVAKKFMGLPADEVVVEKAVQALGAFFDVVEKLLQHTEFMAGAEYTLADLYYVPLIQRLMASGYADLIESRPAVAKWWRNVAARPATRQIFS
ncbi:glutathione S-transferase [Microdochium bolleyi]|uniref:glutathione transferase n=1 Tax=Microdochium bolleyi TaxID=196109 RepID=A0A136IL78_9PEZI|nr:glutathione S-transferase [Microdochium bolleyi]